MNWYNSTPYGYQFFHIFPTVRSLFQTVLLLNMSPKSQNAYFRQRKSLNMGSKGKFRAKIYFKYEYFRLNLYCFLRIFSPVRLFQTVRLFQSLD